MKRRGGVPSTFTAPHVAAAPPRCEPCDQLVHDLEHAPQKFAIGRLRELLAWLERASPRPGAMVRADADGVEVWACPYHNSLERHVGRTRRGRQTTTWKVVKREEAPTP